MSECPKIADESSDSGGIDGERLVELDWMLVETPEPESNLGRFPKPGHEGENRCTYCVSNGDYTWYSNQEVMVIRHWKSTSQDVPGGGHWTWYCPKHFERRRGIWWRNSHQAPARLLPPVRHTCDQAIGLGSRCNAPAIQSFDGIWFCEPHATAERNLRRFQELLDEGSLAEDPLDV